MPTLDTFADGESECDDGGTVLATCTSCGDKHAVADRKEKADTTAATVCPACGSPGYSSEVADE